MQDQPVIAALAKCPPERDLARSLVKFHQKVLFFNYDRPCLQAGIPTHVHDDLMWCESILCKHIRDQVMWKVYKLYMYLSAWICQKLRCF